MFGDFFSKVKEAILIAILASFAFVAKFWYWFACGVVLIALAIMVFSILHVNDKSEPTIKTEVINDFAPYSAPSHPDWKELVQNYDRDWNLKEEYISFGETVCYNGGFLTVYVKGGPIWIKADNVRITPIREAKE